MKSLGAGGAAQQLRVLPALAEDQVRSYHIHSGSQLSVSLVLTYMMPFPGPYYQVIYMAYTHTAKTSTHKNLSEFLSEMGIIYK